MTHHSTANLDTASLNLLPNPTVRPQIITVSAKTMVGDRETCLNAGMDNDAAKPIRVNQLVPALSDSHAIGEADFASASKASPGGGTAPSSQVSVPAILAHRALESLYEMVGADSVAEVIHCYMVEATKHVSAIKTAIEQGNAPALELAANTLKSSSAFLGAVVFSELCREIEAIGRAGMTQAAIEKLPGLDVEFQRVKAALRAHLRFTRSSAQLSPALDR